MASDELPTGGTIVVSWARRAELVADPEWLDAAERARRDRFRPPLGETWAASRCWLRARLGAALGIEPGAVPLVESASGRPELRDGRGDLDFNLAHTDGVVVLAIGRGRVGVDVEDPPPLADDLLSMAAIVGTDREVDELRRARPADRRLLFQRWWVRKEAVLKAEGRGFLTDARQVHVGVTTVAPPAPWCIVDVGACPPGAGWPGALVGVATDGTVRGVELIERA